MVFQCMDHDLTGVLSQAQFTLSSAQLRSLCQRMLVGLSYLPRPASHGLKERLPRAQSNKLLDANPANINHLAYLITCTLQPIKNL